MHIRGRARGLCHSCADDPQRSDRSNGAIRGNSQFLSAHTFYWGDRHASIFMGPERAANRARRVGHWMPASGLAHTSIRPSRPCCHCRQCGARERQSTSGAVLGPAQRIGRMPALRAVTIDAAWQVFMDEQVGSIVPGKRADLVVLSDNPLTADNIRAQSGSDHYRWHDGIQASLSCLSPNRNQIWRYQHVRIWPRQLPLSPRRTAWWHGLRYDGHQVPLPQR